MAQTKRKRRTKHRGNAAGMIEARGRTGRRLSPAEQKAAAKQQSAADRRLARIDRAPTWRSAVNKAALAAAFFLLLIVLIFRQPIAQAAGLATFTFVIYVPLSYYTDFFIYSRAQKKKLEEGRSR